MYAHERSLVKRLQGQPFADAAKVGMTGFCFGGGVTWRVATQMPELLAAVPFYGPHPPLEDVPNIQAALPGLDEISVWLGLVAPKGTPSAVVDKLQAEVAKVLADPAVKAKADASGLFPATSTPAEFSAFIRREAERWSAVVKESGMRYD